MLKHEVDQLVVAPFGIGEAKLGIGRALFAQQLDDDSKRRLHTNPLRILDSKNPDLQDLIRGAPKLVERLGADSRAHFDGVQQLLADHGIAFAIDARLVRGLDYYNRTVFEWVTDRLGAQSTIAGGGRYDGLFAMLGGKATPACGFGLGMGLGTGCGGAGQAL